MLKQCGLTLLELVTSLLVLAVLVFFGLSLAPLQQQALRLRADELKSIIRYAKQQAQLSSKPLALTPWRGRSDWSDGMVLFEDNAKHAYDAKAHVIREWHFRRKGVSIGWHGFQSSHYLVFSASLHRRATNGNFILTAPTQEKVILAINRLGRVREVSATTAHIN